MVPSSAFATGPSCPTGAKRWSATCRSWPYRCSVDETAGACVEDVVPCQDGCMIFKELFSPDILVKIYTKIEVDTGFRVQWVAKPFDEPLPRPITPASMPGDKDMREYNFMDKLIQGGLLDKMIHSHFDDIGCALKGGLGDDGLRLWQMCGRRNRACNVASLKGLWDDPAYLSGEWILELLRASVEKTHKAQYKRDC